LGAIELGVPRARLQYTVWNAHREHRRGRFRRIDGFSRFLFSAQLVYSFMRMRIQYTTASFFCRKPYLKGIGMLSAKAGQGASCAHASSHRERGL